MSITLLSVTYVDFGIAKGLSRAPANRLGTVLSPKGIPLVRVAAPDPSKLGPAARAFIGLDAGRVLGDHIARNTVGQ